MRGPKHPGVIATACEEKERLSICIGYDNRSKLNNLKLFCGAEIKKIYVQKLKYLSEKSNEAGSSDLTCIKVALPLLVHL